jgi:cytochrome b561
MMPNNSSARSAGTGQRTSTGQGYGPTAKSLHWLIMLLVLAQFFVAILMPDIGPKTVPGILINLHLSLGVVILALTAVRFVYRQLHPVPLDMPDSPAWQRSTARATHLAFYLILLTAPFLGWASASAHGLPINVFGIVPLPDIAAPRAGWALTAGDVHGYMMWTLLALIALHAAAALYHGLLRHDGVLQRMLPAGGK